MIPRFRVASSLLGLSGAPGNRLIPVINGNNHRGGLSPTALLLNREGRVDRSFGTAGSLALEGRPFGGEIGIIPGRDGRSARFVGSAGGRDKAVREVLVGPEGRQFVRNLPRFKKDDFQRVQALRAGGYLVLGGQDGKGRRGFRIARHGRDGNLDRSFGRQGFIRTFFAGQYTGARFAKEDRRGRITVAGGRGAFARYLPDGRLDRSFGGDGRVVHGLGEGAGIEGLTVLGDGRVVAMVEQYHTCSRNCFNGLRLLGLRADGRKDRSFLNGGRRIQGFGRSFWVTGLFPAGRHGVDLVVSVEPCGAKPAVGVMRLGRSGRPDRSFGGGDGLVSAVPRKALGAWATEAVRQPSGRMAIGAYLDIPGREGGAEGATGITRVRLGADDGVTRLDPCPM